MKLILVGLTLFSFSTFSLDFKYNVSRQEMLDHGRSVYESRCLGCHGQKGDGQGLAAPFLDPRPRDFTSGVFKFRSTPLDTLPTDRDLMKTISQGILGTSMPGFPLLSDTSKLAVIEYIKTFSPKWKDPGLFANPVVGSPFPRQDFIDFTQFKKRAQKGRSLFIEACVTCHGLKGQGDGDGSEGLVDDWDNPIKPGNLTKIHIKTGRSVREIYRTLLTGVGGTPMASYKDIYTDDQLWDLSAYVLSLRGVTAKVYGEPILPEIQQSEYE